MTEPGGLPPTQRRGRNGWDAITEVVRVVVRFLGSPAGILILLIVALAAGWVGEETLEKLVEWVKSLRE